MTEPHAPAKSVIAHIVPTLLIIAVDQLSKQVIVMGMTQDQRISIIDGFFRIVHVRNTGGVAGFFTGYNILLAILSIVVLGIIIKFYCHLTENWRERDLALILIISGVVGNLIDRLFRGSVVDFISFYYGKHQWPAFNVADSAICIGVSMFILSSWLRKVPDNATDTATNDEDGLGDSPVR